MDESFENGQEISTNDGILLRRGPAAFMPEITNSTTGTLILMHYVHHIENVLCIEWKPNDFLIADADAQEQGEWSFVDTIAKRQRTASESLVFNTHSETITHKNNSSPVPPPRPRVIRVVISDLRHIEVLKNGHVVRLVNKSDNKVHSEYFFQHGNADGFVRGLQTTHCLQRSHYKKDLYEVVENIEHDQEKLKKTFAELKIEDIKGPPGSWVTSLVRDPIGHTWGFLARMSDAYTVFPGVGSGIGSNGPRSTNRSCISTPIHDSSSSGYTADEYEVLGSSPLIADMVDNHIKELESKLPPRPNVVRGSLLTRKQWGEFMSEDGRISDVDRVKEIVFRGGIEYSLREEVWKYLLGYFKWDATNTERIVYQKKKNAEYFKMKMQWLSMSEIQEQHHSHYQIRKSQIEKDVQRTDRSVEYFSGENNPNLGRLQDILMTFVMYNFDVGYVQGMSDLLAPILCVMQDESDSFWCFVGFMEMVYTNFDMDQAGMKRQLRDVEQLLAFVNPRLSRYFKEHQSDNMYMCFRWLLVWFKREFVQYDIMSLWEVLWTGLPSINFHLLISVAILDDQMDVFISRGYGFNEILKHVNELSYRIDYRSILRKAESIYLQIMTSTHLTDDIRVIFGIEPLAMVNSPQGDDEDDSFDNIVPVEKTLAELEVAQRKYEEAYERSTWHSLD